MASCCWSAVKQQLNHSTPDPCDPLTHWSVLWIKAKMGCRFFLLVCVWNVKVPVIDNLHLKICGANKSVRLILSWIVLGISCSSLLTNTIAGASQFCLTGTSGFVAAAAFSCRKLCYAVISKTGLVFEWPFVCYTVVKNVVGPFNVKNCNTRDQFPVFSPPHWIGCVNTSVFPHFYAAIHIQEKSQNFMVVSCKFQRYAEKPVHIEQMRVIRLTLLFPVQVNVL